jgi:hypothetical protein
MKTYNDEYIKAKSQHLKNDSKSFNFFIILSLNTSNKNSFSLAVLIKIY